MMPTHRLIVNPSGGTLPIIDYIWRVPLERGSFFRMEVYKRVGISRVEVWKGVVDCLQSAFSLEVHRVFNPKQARSQKVAVRKRRSCPNFMSSVLISSVISIEKRTANSPDRENCHLGIQ